MTAPDRPRQLLVLSLVGSGRRQALAARLAQWRARRAPAATAVLVCAAGGDAPVLDWPAGTRVLMPTDLLPAGSHDEIERGVSAAVHELVHGAGRPLFPEVEGVHLGELARSTCIAELRHSLLLQHVFALALARLAPRRTAFYGGDWATAEALRRQAEAAGVPFRARLAQLRQWWYTMRLPWPQRPRRAAAVPAELELVREAAGGVLIVSESRPMAQMFREVERHLPAHVAGPVVRLQYRAGQEATPASTVGRLADLPRPDHPTPPPPWFARWRREAHRRARTLQLAVQCAGTHVEIPADSLLAALAGGEIAQAAAYVMRVSAALAAARPAVIVVGNDRWWLGQSWTQVARRRGIPTVAVQDGLAGSAEWGFRTASVVAASGGFLGELLAEHGEPNARVVVTGQPRYDPIIASLREPADPSVRDELCLPADAVAVLFATQTKQEFAYVERVSEAVLRVPGVHLVLRPHPLEDPSPHRALARRLGPRVHFAHGLEIFGLLRTCQALVCQSSTVVLEAALLGRPVLAVNLSGTPDHTPYARTGLTQTCTTPDGLTDAVRRLVNGDRTARADDDARVAAALAALLGPVDGKAGERVAALIADLARDQLGRSMSPSALVT